MCVPQRSVDRPVDRHAQRAQVRNGQPTGMHHVSVGDGRPKEGVSRLARSTDRRICFSCWDSNFVSEKEPNLIVVS